MGIIASHKEEKGNSCTLSHVFFLIQLLSVEKSPPTKLFPPSRKFYFVLLCVAKRNRRDRQLHTPTPGESVKIPELPFAFRVMLARNANSCHARIPPLIPIPASPKTKTRRRADEKGNLVGLGATGTLGSTGLEAVQEAAVDIAEGAHAAGAGGLAALSLLTPVDC